MLLVTLLLVALEMPQLPLCLLALEQRVGWPEPLGLGLVMAAVVVVSAYLLLLVQEALVQLAQAVVVVVVLITASHLALVAQAATASAV
jgi:hypothetical protein